MKKKLWRAVILVVGLSIVISSCIIIFVKKPEKKGNSVVTTDGDYLAKEVISVDATSNIMGDDAIQIGKPPEITGVVAFPADGIGKAGVDYIELATGPADDWGDIKVPYFNPRGSKSLYEGGNIYYRQDGGFKLEVLDGFFTNTFHAEGEEWNMTIRDPEFKIFWLRAYAKKLGATFYESPGDTAVFHVKENENSQYWVKAELSDDGCALKVVHTDVAPTGKTLTIKPADYSKNYVSFYTDCEQGKLQSVTVTLKGAENSGVKLSCENDRQYGEYTRMMRKEIANAEELNTKKTDVFVYDDIPITDGQLKWTFNWESIRGTVKPSEITFQINNIADMEPVKNGVQLGMLRVVGVPMGEVEILPGDCVENRHPEFDNSYIIGTRDKDGNTIFSLASGYYSVRFGSSHKWGRNNAIHGRRVLESVASDENFLQVMYNLSCIPNGEIYNNRYSPEAVITQGWGTELDLARLALDMLSRLGYQPKILTVKLTATGLENVKRITGLESEKFMPAIAYTDSQGRQKVFVLPFMRDISKLTGLAYIANANQYRNNFGSGLVHMTITARAQIIKQPGGLPQAEAFDSLNAMFGDEGGSSGEKPIYENITLFDKDISYADMSLDAVDISFAPIGTSADGQHEIIAALVDTKQGILYSDKLYIDTSFYNIESVTVNIDIPQGGATHTTYLTKGQKLSDIFQTLAFNVPGMTKAAAETLQKAVEAKAAEGKDAGDYATVKWLGHATVNKFVRELTAFEEENMPLFGVKAARIDSCPLVLMVTMVSDGKNANATVDIMKHEIKMLNNPDKKKAKTASVPFRGFL